MAPPSAFVLRQAKKRLKEARVSFQKPDKTNDARKQENNDLRYAGNK